MLGATAAGLCLALLPRIIGDPEPTTVVVSPHPDDEVLRLTAYLLERRNHGDRPMLVAVTDGGASSSPLATMVGREAYVPMRVEEQTRAWAELTGGGSIMRLDLPDGGVTTATLTARLRPILDDLRAVRLVAACHTSDEHPDHRVVAETVQTIPLDIPHERWLALPPGATAGDVLHACPDLEAARRADDAYAAFGHQSVPTLMADLRNSSYASNLVLLP